MDTITIDIFLNSEGEYQYDIYENPEALENGEDALDGGICTSDINNALEMAFDQAKEILKRVDENKKL